MYLNSLWKIIMEYSSKRPQKYSKSRVYAIFCCEINLSTQSRHYKMIGGQEILNSALLFQYDFKTLLLNIIDLGMLQYLF